MDTFDTARTLFLEGLACIQSHNYGEAERKLRASLNLIPDRLSTLTNLSFVLIRLQKYDEADRLIGTVLARDPNAAEGWLNLGLIARDRNRDFETAIKHFDAAIAINPDYAEAFLNRAVTLSELKRYDAALDSYDRAVALKPDLADIFYNRGETLRELRLYRDAITNYDRAWELNPEFDFLVGARLHTKMQICDWSDFDGQMAYLTDGLTRGKKVVLPFSILSLTDKGHLQQRAASIWANEKYGPSSELGGFGQRVRRDKIRIGYFSADFREHPVAYLISEMLELHDRSKFEVFGFSYGPDSVGPMRNRLVEACDTFIEIESLSDRDAALLARKHNIDIAIDLTGYTQYGRTGIFARRAAPVQVSYLGYAGTSATSYLDYIVADDVIVPDTSREHFSEKIAYLPDSYQPNDRKRAISDRIFTRPELDLPENSFVFCCFNNSYKITPSVFTVWMRILANVPGSVIWFREDNELASDNLRREALRRSIDPDRLIFAKRMASLDDHLARYRSADLFLDTFPFNAHTTASDALWAGLPLLTSCGEALASRVAASLLKAVGLADLITADITAYETTAISLAHNPARLAAKRRTLAENRLSAPLFDTPMLTKYIEELYTQMYQRDHDGLPPDHLRIAALKQIRTPVVIP